MEKYLAWLGISFESWGLEKVNWMLLESLIDEVEVDGKSLCMLWPPTYEKKIQRKSFFTTSTYLQIQSLIITNFTAINVKGSFWMG